MILNVFYLLIFCILHQFVSENLFNFNGLYRYLEVLGIFLYSMAYVSSARSPFPLQINHLDHRSPVDYNIFFFIFQGFVCGGFRQISVGLREKSRSHSPRTHVILEVYLILTVIIGETYRSTPFNRRLI